jgi:hypothetical protein
VEEVGFEPTQTEVKCFTDIPGSPTPALFLIKDYPTYSSFKICYFVMRPLKGSTELAPLSNLCSTNGDRTRIKKLKASYPTIRR